jgi:predicted dienelactone hydrolase
LNPTAFINITITLYFVSESEDKMLVKRSLFTLMVAALIMSGLASVSLAQDEIQRTGFRFDAPPYGIRGSYWVGTMDMVIEPDSERPLNVTIWYPALNPEGVEVTTSYAMPWKFLPVPEPSEATVSGHALRDASVDMAAAPYPLVVFSHGFSASAPFYIYLVEHYVSYGFVVIAPDHQELMDMNFSYDELWESSIERPRDIRQTLDYAESLTAVGGAMAGMIDMEHVAVVGHSYGGYTALAMAGARYDLQGFNQRCEEARAAEDPNVWLCDPLLPHEADMATLAGYNALPEGLWDSMGDPRVDAIIPMAGDSYLFDEAGLAEISIPVMAMGGTLDTGTPYEWGTKPTYEYATSTQKILVGFENAEHMAFGVKCDEAPFWVDLGLGSVCEDAVWDMDRIHDLIDHFSTAFLLATLKGDADAAAALSPEAAQFPGVIYEAQGF